MSVHADVAVVGAGPAGIAAAVAAADAGAAVVVLDRYGAPGGQIWKRSFRGPAGLPPEARRWLATFEASPARLRAGTSVWGVRDGHVLLTEDADGRAGAVCAETIVIATGAYDRPVAFPGWTLPGVFTAGAAQTLANAQETLPGRRVLLVGAGPFLLPVAAQLRASGADVVAVAEATRRADWLRAGPRMLAHPARLREYARYRARLRGVPFAWGHIVVRAEGDGRVERAALASVDGDWRPRPGTERMLDVDAVCTAYGFVPSLELPRALGCAVDGDAVTHDEHMRTSVPHVFVAGEAAGVGGAELAVLEGTVAGRAAAGAARGEAATSEARRAPSRLAAGDAVARRLRHAARFAAVLDALFGPRPGLLELPDPDTILCRCEDVTAGEVDAAARAATSPSALKIATRCGQGPCQGRMCAPLVTARLPGSAGFSPRPPLRPVALSTLMDDPS